jgi:monomeric isocitrate dehydrogenase
MSILSKAAILAANDKKMVEIDVPEWGGIAKIRVMSGTERDRFESEFVGNNKSVDMVRAKLVAKCLCDEDGNRLFTEQEIPQLGEKSASVLDKLFTTCMKLNRFTKDDVEDLAGNS